MITYLATLLAPHIGDKFAKPAAIAALVIAAIPVLIGLKFAYDASVIESHTNKANAEQMEDLNTATGEADEESDKRREDHEARVKTTEELIDEAIEKGCAVGEYLASVGERCVH